MKKIITTLTICLLAFQGMAQSIDRQVISSFGLISTTASSTVGEVVTETKTNGSFTINQGFQQTTKKAEDPNTSIEKLSLNVDYSLFPNPTINTLNLELSAAEKSQLNIQIYNAVGQAVSTNQEVNLKETWTGNWDVSFYTAGVYFLNIKDENQKIVETIRFIKK